MVVQIVQVVCSVSQLPTMLLLACKHVCKSSSPNQTCLPTVLQALSHSPQSSALRPPIGLGYKACRSQDLDSQGSLDSDSQSGVLTSTPPAGFRAPRLSHQVSSQLSVDSDSGSDQLSVSAASVSVTQAGAFPVMQGSRSASRQGLDVKSSMTMERFPVSPRLLGRRSVSLSRQPYRTAMQDGTAAAVAALQMRGAPLQRLSSKHADKRTSGLPRSSSSSETSSRSRSSAVQNYPLIDLQHEAVDASCCATAGTSPDVAAGKGLLSCVDIQGGCAGQRAMLGEKPDTKTLVHVVQAANELVINIYSNAAVFAKLLGMKVR